jgi:site-specific DNA recombinase
MAKHDYPLTGFAVCGHCGSPLVGTCLKGGYRYYHCRGTYPTASREKYCDARYVKAEWLENVAWEKAKATLSDPGVLITEVSKNLEAERQEASLGNLEHEIKVLTCKLKQYPGQERRLMKVLRLDIATPDVVLDELNEMKKEEQEDKEKLSNLLKVRESITRMEGYEDRLKELCARIVPDLESCASQDKKDAYTYLGLEIKATPEGADIKGYLPSVRIAGQSSGCPTARTTCCIPFHAYVSAPAKV